MPSAPDKTLPRCLLCGMHCPVGVRRDRFEHLQTVFPADMGAERGACVLGLTAGRLIAADERVFRARVDGAPSEREAAVAALADRLRIGAAGRTALIVDLNRPLENLACAHALATQALPGSTVSAFVPAQDAAVAEAGVDRMPPLAELGGRDLVVTVGDVCSSHPAIARLLRDMQRAERGNRWISIDTAPSRTTRAADEQIVVRPEALAAFVCAVAVTAGGDDLAVALGESDPEAVDWHAGLMPDRIRDLAGRLEGAARAGFVLSSGLGRYSHASSAVAAVQTLAQACGGMAWVLPLCMNSFALPALAGALSLRPLGDLQQAVEAGDVDTLMVVGFDPGAAFPERIWRPWLDRTQNVLWAGSVACQFSEAADVAVPLALAWEESGSMVCRSGELGRYESWASPPAGIPTTEELMQATARALGRSSMDPLPVADIVASPPPPPSLGDVVAPGILDVPEPSAGRVTVVGAPEPHGYTGGLCLAQSAWQVRAAGEESACSGFAAEGVVTLGEPPGIAVPCRVPHGTEWKDPVVAVPAHWPATRELLDWQASPSGTFRAEPRTAPMTAHE